MVHFQCSSQFTGLNVWDLVPTEAAECQRTRELIQQTSSLCVRYIWSHYLTSETQWKTLCQFVSGVEDYKHITMTTYRNANINDVMGARNNWTLENTASVTTPSPLSMVWAWNKATVTAHCLKCWTKLAELTLASEGSGSLVKPHQVHGHLHLRPGCHWGCRISENKRWQVVQQTSSLCVRYIWCQYLTIET